MTPSARLKAANLTLAYGRDTIVQDLDIEIPDRGFTVIVGANGSGKSTLLKALGRLLSPSKGTVVLDGRALSAYPSIEVARHIGIHPQSATAPDRITVIDLVARGRYPHQTFLRQWSDADERAVDAALAATGIAEIATRAVDTLSGGQRQRVWIAMVLAQETPILLLDEPTTYLDMAHQVELLDLLADLNEAAGRTIVAVLHDLNQACRYASHIVALKSGRVIAEGPPAQIVTEALMEVVFGLPCVVVDDPVTHTPHVVPRGRRKASGRGGV
ncbi:UNVERIFIED_ORG: iron complex transport system ATP-binding protein [Shinella zoogloeoides]|nr:iron complex transport system ATP-binding protein [Shinella zoogloeoides]